MCNQVCLEETIPELSLDLSVWLSVILSLSLMCVCMYMCACVCRHMWKSQEGVGSPEAGVADGYEPTAVGS